SPRKLGQNPLLDKVMASDHHEPLPDLPVEANPVMSMGMPLTAQVLATRAGHVPQRLRHRAAEICARVFISYAISPPDEANEVVAASLAELVCNGLSDGRNS